MSQVMSKIKGLSVEVTHEKGSRPPKSVEDLSDFHIWRRDEVLILVQRTNVRIPPHPFPYGACWGTTTDFN